MKCPVCKTEELDFSSLESNLTSRHCDRCGGNWIPSFEYWKWRELHKEGLPQGQAEQTVPPNPVTSALVLITGEDGSQTMARTGEDGSVVVDSPPGQSTVTFPNLSDTE